jgi:hypothetical protein
VVGKFAKLGGEVWSPSEVERCIGNLSEHPGNDGECNKMQTRGCKVVIGVMKCRVGKWMCNGVVGRLVLAR